MIEITEDALHELPAPNQILGEWKMYLRFLRDYCIGHGISNPVVVEIGTQANAQKAHYEKFLDAVHIGIDISPTYAVPDIIGDSHKPTTMAALKRVLDGRQVNFLFIDGAHTYNDTVADYWAYGPMARDIIAFHDIRHEKEIGRLWQDLQEAERGNPEATFLKIGAWGGGWCELGIGLLVKQRRENMMGIKNG